MDVELGQVQLQFAQLLWEKAPIGSGQLVKLCEQELNWKKPTTYTVLRKLCEKGLFRNQDGVVTPLVSREEFYAAKSEKFVEDTFGGSLPTFLASFTSRKGLTAREAEQIRKLIDAFEKEG